MLAHRPTYIHICIYIYIYIHTYMHIHNHITTSSHFATSPIVATHCQSPRFVTSSHCHIVVTSSHVATSSHIHIHVYMTTSSHLATSHIAVTHCQSPCVDVLSIVANCHTVTLPHRHTFNLPTVTHCFCDIDCARERVSKGVTERVRLQVEFCCEPPPRVSSRGMFSSRVVALD